MGTIASVCSRSTEDILVHIFAFGVGRYANGFTARETTVMLQGWIVLYFLNIPPRRVGSSAHARVIDGGPDDPSQRTVKQQVDGFEVMG